MILCFKYILILILNIGIVIIFEFKDNLYDCDR